MSNEEIAMRKLELLMRAAEQAGEQEETLAELKAAAFEVLLLHPGSEPQGWASALCHQYATELMDVYGTDPKNVQNGLARLWNTRYLDENSGLEYTFNQWSEAFATEASVQMYHDLINKEKI